MSLALILWNTESIVFFVRAMVALLILVYGRRWARYVTRATGLALSAEVLVVSRMSAVLIQ